MSLTCVCKKAEVVDLLLKTGVVDVGVKAGVVDVVFSRQGSVKWC